MRRALTLLTLVLILLPTAEALGDSFLGLCYHRIRDGGAGGAMATDRFIAQLSWLREHGYQPIGIDDLLAAREGRRPLPEKAVLLTFDDGHVEFYTRVYPLLRLFNYPAVLAVVGRWMTESDQVAYGDRALSREEFLTWDQIREMAASGLVEIASHTFDLHRGVPANPQGNLQPAATGRIFDPDTGRYEDDAVYLQRLRTDFATAADLIARETGRRPRVIVWPYGKYNGPALLAAREVGMTVGLSLEWGENTTGNLAEIGRILVEENVELADFIWMLRHPRPQEAHRVVHVDLDYVYDPDPQRLEANLGRLLDRIKGLGIDTVYLQAFADPDGNGTAEALYFPNRHLPVRADLFNRAAWQLKTRAGVRVFAWMPVLGFAVGGDDLLVQAQGESGTTADPQAYRRLSPFAPEARRLIGEIYEDLARYADFDGILFHDDAFLADREDAGPHALAWYRQAGLPDSIESLQADPALRERWTRLKTLALVDFTDEMADRVRHFRPSVRTARNLYARPLLEPESEAWLAQSYPVFLERYDQVAVMAMPYLENAAKPEAWLRRLVGRAAGHPNGLRKTVFELQSQDWRQTPARPVPTEAFVRQMRLLQSLGAASFGYYPDDFLSDEPQANVLRGAFSLNSYPFGP